MHERIAVKFEGINKHFGPTHASRDINLEIKAGEIHGLVGENGSGKSTLMSILAGIYSKDSGTITINGAPYDPKSPSDAVKAKIGMIVQELGMVGNLSIGINIFLGRLGPFRSKLGMVELRKVYAAGHELMEKWGLGSSIPLEDLAAKHSIETRKMGELVRALSIDPEILIIDEMTQALSQDSRNMLYHVIQQCKEQGRTIIIISHDLEELMEITDTITVLRDGEIVGTVDSETTQIDTIKRMMVGREVDSSYYREDQEEDYDDQVMLQVDHLSSRDGKVKDVSFSLHRGEILAVCGLSDAGIHDLGKVLMGLEPRSAGTVTITESNTLVHTPMEAIRSRMCYLPKDRDGEAMMLDASICDNICIPNVRHLAGKLDYMSAHKMDRLTEEGIQKFDIKCVGPHQKCSDLSGGNKQKVNLGRWMLYDNNIFILDCPTRGVDVGVKAFIYDLMKKNKQLHYATLLISDELVEAMGMADRIMVMKDGTIASVISRSSGFTEEALIEVML